MFQTIPSMEPNQKASPEQKLIALPLNVNASAGRKLKNESREG